MKFETLSCLILTTLLSACGSNGASPTATAPASPSLGSATHDSNLCPRIDGDYFQNGGQSRKSFQTTSLAGGIQLVDSGVVWTIDGKSHVPADGPPTATYTGVCEKDTILLDLFEGSQPLGRMTYTLQGPQQVQIEMIAKDPRLENSMEVWTK